MTRKASSGVVGYCLFLALASCSSGAEAPPPPALGGPPPPSVMQVTCHAEQTEVSATTVATRPEGLHVRVTDSSGLSGTYLNYSSDGPNGLTPGGGDAVSAGTSSRVLQVPPGPVLLNCSFDTGATKTPPVTVDLQDPGRHFQVTTLADLGCNPTSIPSWVYGDGRGTTADAAVRALLDKAPPAQELHPRLAPVGYIAAATVTYLIDRDGSPWATATVTGGDGQFTANLDQLC